MSKIKYKMEVYHSGTKQVRISSIVELMIPGVFEFGESDWTTNKWDENSRSAKLIRAIGDKKKLGFVTIPGTESQYWMRRYVNKEEIGVVMIKVMGNGFNKRVHLHEVKLVAPSQFPYMSTPNFVCFGYSLQFNDSDIGENWSLSN